MKGVQGIVIAVALGLTGAFCNWFYVSRQAGEYERVRFVAVSADAQINMGDRFKESHFATVEIPRANVGNLSRTAVLWRDLPTVINMRATRAYRGGEILLQQDLKTPARQDLASRIGRDERVMWLPVDQRTFDAAHVNPGDLVSFQVPALLNGSPVPAGSSAGGSGYEIIGPFRILALGNRMGTREVQRAAGGSRNNSENRLAVSVRVDGNRLESKAERISEVLRVTNFQGVQVLLHPEEDRKEG
ncbi:MAG: hypothetical protein KDA79_01060 [Planctomycetaceae bacterium]|nr:hypothetical protein [Planctomycetaceae bacterium]